MTQTQVTAAPTVTPTAGVLGAPELPRVPGESPASGWQLPDSVEPPSLAGVRGAILRTSDLVGLTPAGWTALVVVLVAASLGLVLHWQELVLVAVMVLALVVVAVAFTIGRPRFAVRLDLESSRVRVGETAHGALAVRNQAVRRSLPSRLDLPVGEQVASFGVPTLAAGAEHEEQFVVSTDRRGVILLGPVQSVQGDPFALAGRATRWTQVAELFVHPLTVDLPGRHTGFVHDLEGHASNQLTNSDMSFHALREYVPGDDRRHIHWRSSARTGQLMVRQFEESRQSRVAVALDTSPQSYLTDEEFELAVSAVGSVALQCVREDNPFAVMTQTASLPAVGALRVLDELARVEQSSRGGVLALVRAVQNREPGASIVVLVTGSGQGLESLRRAVRAFDVDTRVIALATQPDAELSVRTVANTTVVRLDDLANLPRAMRRAMA
ncbi:DUF58 domain-containing protein [Aestuariimicrobium sp. T2.26MG-19.2B]|uniref:DUF58 domain-containing protein n=1 Tax=Aestuariimicrobium sp. T2.26MG-19.2B TaxID=3040679 RepID=UPI0024776328|nr:DUF58 domain-containing protein [Aestuariimicrobium sp. T2.26MG-19.2B]CAI9401643.1 hypothetical protein AESSP_00633 [Aestuariimicrobium sp. T2.26MG-19.2B]